MLGKCVALSALLLYSSTFFSVYMQEMPNPEPTLMLIRYRLLEKFYYSNDDKKKEKLTKLLKRTDWELISIARVRKEKNANKQMAFYFRPISQKTRLQYY